MNNPSTNMSSAIVALAILKSVFWLIILFVWMPWVGVPLWLETVRLIANAALNP